jgi:hypothetical protein
MVMTGKTFRIFVSSTFSDVTYDLLLTFPPSVELREQSRSPI